MSELPAFIVKYVGEILIHFESYFLKFKNMRTKKTRKSHYYQIDI